jgi:hypothetical protein
MDSITYARPDLTGRQPALRGFIIRRLFAAKAVTGRQVTIEACRAEISWSVADWKRLHPLFHGWNEEAEGMAAATRLPHERAAARVLNCWGHLHPIEWRTMAIIKMLRDGCHHPQAVLGDLRWYLTERRRLAKAFFAAVTEYRRLRLLVEDPTDGAPGCRKEAA